MGNRLFIRRVAAFLISTVMASYAFLITLAIFRRGEYEAIIPASFVGLILWALFFLIFPWVISKRENTTHISFLFFCTITIIYGALPIIAIYILKTAWWPWKLDTILIGLFSGLISGLVSGPVYWLINYKTKRV